MSALIDRAVISRESGTATINRRFCLGVWHSTWPGGLRRSAARPLNIALTEFG